MQFDLHSSQGVVQALQAIRGSSLSPEEKSALRDLVFLYTNSGGDQEIKTQLEDRLKNLTPAPASPTPAEPAAVSASTPEPAPQTPAPQPVAEAPAPQEVQFSSTRPVPSFQSTNQVKPPTPQPAPQPAAEVQPPAPQVVPQAPVQPVTPMPNPASAPVATPVVPPQPPVTPPAPTPQPAPQPPVQPAPPAPQPATVVQPPVPQPAPQVQAQPAPTAPVVPPQPPVTPTPQPAPQPPVQPAPPVPTPVAAPVTPPQVPVVDMNAIESDALNRIRQIKAEVNAAVGNPVNLIDINNEVGREYMNSLLSAMKKLNAGAPGELSVAMEKLESAFVLVKKAIAEGPVAKPEVPTPKPTIEQEVPQQSAPISNTSPQTEPSTVPPTAPMTPLQPTPQMPEQSESSPKDTQSLVDTLTANLKAQKKENTVHIEHAPTESVSNPQPSPEPTVQSVQVPAPQPSTIPTQQPSVVPAPQSAKEAILEQSPKPVVSQKIGYGDTGQTIQPVSNTGHAFTQTPTKVVGGKSDVDVNSPEVTSGLTQLLSEWSLFKSSGLFGTGPNGIEHPLYLKLKDLPVAHILAGRYEGSKPEVKQSVTDYMNGWRYEQGIIYNPGETFESYLRRVIKQIIDSQKNKPAA